MTLRSVTKLVQNLEKKKFREKYNLFKVEGEKMVAELLRTELKIDTLVATEGWCERMEQSDNAGEASRPGVGLGQGVASEGRSGSGFSGGALQGVEVVRVTEAEMKKLSDFQSPPEVLALVEIPSVKIPSPEELEGELVLLLNGIQDPGNLGTIRRLADRFGVKHIICDRDCANIYGPKCVQASMGAIFRVSLAYTELLPWLSEAKGRGITIFGTFLHGESIYKSSLPEKGIIVMGNEGHGISAELESLVDVRLTIPSFAESGRGSESLNVGVATGIILSEFKRF